MVRNETILYLLEKGVPAKGIASALKCSKSAVYILKMKYEAATQFVEHEKKMKEIENTEHFEFEYSEPLPPYWVTPYSDDVVGLIRTNTT